MLLLLRVDRRLEWKEIAQVTLDEDSERTKAALTKESQAAQAHPLAFEPTPTLKRCFPDGEGRRNLTIPMSA